MTQDYGSTLQRLKTVKAARRQFLAFWAMQHLTLRKAAADYAAGRAETAPAVTADPFDHDWSKLYRGSILDD